MPTSVAGSSSTDEPDSSASGSSRMPIGLPNECWLDILHFCPRLHLANAVSLCCRRLHALAYPLLHELGAQRCRWIHAHGEPDNPQACRTWSLWNNAPPDPIPMDMAPPKNIVCVESLCIDQHVTPGVCAFIAFLARHGLLRELEVSDFEISDGIQVSIGSEVLRDLISQFPALFVQQHPPLFTMLTFAQRSSLSRKTRPLLAHPAVLGLPGLGICVGDPPERIGPLLNWLHWPSATAQQQQRLLHITIGGAGDPQFLLRFLVPLQKRFLGAKRRRPYRVLIWIWTNHARQWPVLDAEPEWHNARSREVLRVVAKGTDPERKVHVFHIDRQPEAADQI